MSKKNMLILLNHVAGKGKGKAKLFEMVEIFNNRGYRVTVLPTKSGDGVTEQVKEEAPGQDLIVAVGGDGTLNRVVNGLLQNGYDTPLGYIPLGSTNDFGASLGLSADIVKACESIAVGEPSPIDAGRFNDKYFVYIACTGMFTETSYATPQQLKNALGYSAYILKGISSLPFAHSAGYIIETGEGVIECECLFASVSNSLRAGGIVKLPKNDVCFDDGLFELLAVPTPKNFIGGTSLVNDILSADVNDKNFIYLKSDRFKIRLDTPQVWSLDGENGGETAEAEIAVVRKAINLVK